MLQTNKQTNKGTLCQKWKEACLLFKRYLLFAFSRKGGAYLSVLGGLYGG